MGTSPGPPNASRRVLGISLAISKWVVIVGCGGLLLVVLINLRDEELTPEARALAEFRGPHVPDAQNAYLAMLGSNAPVGTNPVVAGARIVDEHNASTKVAPWRRERLTKSANQVAANPVDGQLKFVGDLAAFCDLLDKDCTPVTPGDLPRIQAMADANAELVSRYIALQDFPAFENTSIPDLRQPASAGGWRGARMLLFARAALDLQSGHEERALAFLSRDIGLWRHILGAGNLIDEAIAVRALASNYRMLCNAIASEAFDVRKYQSELRGMLTPLRPKELDGALMFKHEFELHARLVSTLPRSQDRSGPLDWLDRQLTRLLFKPNASLNRVTPIYVGLRELASRSPPDFAGLPENVQAEADALSEPGITWIYDPVGKLLTAIAIPAYPNFVARVFDLAAFIQLARAQLDLRLAAIAPDGAPAFLAAAAPDTRNPYTGNPFDWNAMTRELSFAPMSSRWVNWSTRATVPMPASKR